MAFEPDHEFNQWRARLPQWGEARAADPVLRRYLTFYGLDFEAPESVTAYPKGETSAALDRRVQHQIGWVASGPHRLAVQRWSRLDDRGTLLLVHGYFDHVGLFGHLVDYGLSRGYSVVAFDLPGHGLSSGERGLIDEFSEYSDAVLRVQAELAGSDVAPWDVIAQSTGGAAMLDLLTCARAGRFRHCVLFAPLIYPRSWWWITWAHRVLRHFVHSIRRGYGVNSHDSAFLAFVKADPLQADTISLPWLGALRRWIKILVARAPVDTPLLVLQGDEDRTVAWRSNLRRIKQLLPAAQVEIIATGRHHLANESDVIRAQLFASIDRNLGV